jgi:DNA-binding transcriptional MerR regulator
MYRIGVVARFAQVSVRTLRHYDEVGLLAPAQVDEVTGYRWYGPDEIARLHRILVMRDLGLSLVEIRELLDTEVTPEMLRGILFLRHAEARERIETEERRLAHVDARIRLLEDDHMTDHDITVKGLDPVWVVGAHEELPSPWDPQHVAAALGRLYPLVHGALAARGAEPGAISYAVYDLLSVDWQEQRVTAALPVSDDVAIDDDGVRTFLLPAVQAATTIVSGAPEAVFGPGFRALHAWLDSMGRAPDVTQLREVYLDCDGARDTWVTELQAVLAPQS